MRRLFAAVLVLAPLVAVGAVHETRSPAFTAADVPPVPQLLPEEPAITSVTPPGALNTTTVRVVIDGTSLPADPLVWIEWVAPANFIDPYLEYVDGTVVSATATQIVADFNLAPLGRPAPPALWDVMVYDVNAGMQTICSTCFEVRGARPTASALGVGRLGQGADTYVEVIGTNLFPWVSASAPGVTGAPDDWRSTTSAWVHMQVDTGAQTGPTDVIVTNTDGQSARCRRCLVIAPGPKLDGTNVAVVERGASGVQVKLTGSNLLRGATIEPPHGVTVRSVRVNSASAVVVTLDVAPDAPVGVQTLTLVNPDHGRASCSCLVVGPAVVVPPIV